MHTCPQFSSAIPIETPNCPLFFPPESWICHTVTKVKLKVKCNPQKWSSKAFWRLLALDLSPSMHIPLILAQTHRPLHTLLLIYFIPYQIWSSAKHFKPLASVNPDFTTEDSDSSPFLKWQLKSYLLIPAFLDHPKKVGQFTHIPVLFVAQFYFEYCLLLFIVFSRIY